MPTPKILSVLQGNVVPTPPIWFMRQAGRYLPEYRALRTTASSFLELCYTPDLATEITLQPIARFDLDAAILFADILIIPDALGQPVSFETGEGPKLRPLKSISDVKQLDVSRVKEHCAPIFQTVKQVRQALPSDKALIGFAGAPWTVATYMLAGKGIKDPSSLRRIVYQDEAFITCLMEKLITATSEYLIEQAKAGADILMLFDSWASGLPTALFSRLCLAPTVEIISRVKRVVPEIPIIVFPRGSGEMLRKYATVEGINAVALDTSIDWSWARTQLSPHIVLQGGLDPLLVVQGGDEMRKNAQNICDCFSDVPYIFNLGHGFVPETPPDHVAELVEFIRSHKKPKGKA